MSNSIETTSLTVCTTLASDLTLGCEDMSTLTSKEVGAILGIGGPAVTEMYRKGKIKGEKKESRTGRSGAGRTSTLYFTRAEVDRYIESQGPYWKVKGPLATKLAEVQAEEGGTRLDDLTVMSTSTDPYRIDSPEMHEAGVWLTEQVERLVPYGTIHLRGLHYAMVMTPGGIFLPDGKQYINNYDCWYFMSEKAADAARWLGYLPFERIHDERNEKPEVFTPQLVEVQTSFDGALNLYLPDNAYCAEPSFSHSRLDYPNFQTFVRQPYNIAMVGEKSSLKSILKPIAQRVGAELLLPTGEISNTMVADLELRAHKDGRPLVVLYFSDFDPAGWGMPNNIARKLQALIDLRGHHDLEVKGVYPVAMTYEQVCELNLPSTPLKPEEKRSDKWKKAWGREQTEIDALATLKPNVLEQIANDAIKPFFDETLNNRVREALSTWEDGAQEALDNDEEYQIKLSEAEELVETINKELAEFRKNHLETSTYIEEPEVPELELPEPEVDVDYASEPIFTTDDNWLTATKKLIARKKYGEEVENE